MKLVNFLQRIWNKLCPTGKFILFHTIPATKYEISALEIRVASLEKHIRALDGVTAEITCRVNMLDQTEADSYQVPQFEVGINSHHLRTTSLREQRTRMLLGTGPVSCVWVGQDDSNKNEIIRALQTHFNFDQITNKVDDFDNACRSVIIGADTHTEFLYAAEHILEQRSDALIFHPSALFCHMDMARRPKYATLGFPGCGNVLVGALSHELINCKKQHLSGPTYIYEEYFYQSALQYYNFIEESIVSLAKPLGLVRFHTIDEDYPFILIHMDFEDGGQLQLCGIVSPRRWTEWRTGSHTSISQLLMREARAQNRTLIRIERHPLDCMLSMCNKVSKDGQKAIDDSNFLKKCSDSIVKYYKSWDCLGGNFLHIQYEDFIENGANGILRLAQILDVDLSENKAVALWEKYGLKPLSSVDSSHFRGGGSDKWRSQFSMWHFGLLKKTGIRELCVDLGYGDPWEGLSEENLRNTEVRSHIHLDDKFFKMITGNIDIPIHGNYHVTIRGKPSERANKLREAILNPAITALLKSGVINGKAGVNMRSIKPIDS